MVSDPLLKSTFPVPNHAALYLASIFLPLLPYLPLIHAASFSKSSLTHSGLLPSCFCYSLSHSLSPLAPSPSICSLCLFALFHEDALAKMGIDCAFSFLSSRLRFPLSPSPSSLCTRALYMLLLGGDVKSSRNAPCKGKKR